VGVGASILVIAALTAFSALVVALRMRETLAALASARQLRPTPSP